MAFPNFISRCLDWWRSSRGTPSPVPVIVEPIREPGARELVPSILNAADKLISCPSLDLVYRSFVELARDALGLERARLYIFSPDGKELRHTYGTNLAGAVVAEGADPQLVKEHWRSFLRIRDPQEKRWMVQQEMRTTWDGTREVECGAGWVAYTPLQTGRIAIGVVCHDAALTNRPHDPERQEMLTVFCSLAANVIERKKNENDLRQHEIKFRHIYERSLVMMYILDPDGKIVDTNAKFLEHTGFRRDEVVGRPLSAFIVELPGERTRENLLTELWTSGRVSEARFAYKKRDGSVMQVLLDCSVATSLQGHPIVLTVVRDITQELAVQVEIRQSREMLQLVINSIPQYIFWKDRQGHYLGCNAHFARLVNLKDHLKIVGLTDQDLPWTSQDAEEFRLVDERVIHSGRIEVQIARRKIFGPGRSSWVESTRVPLRDAQGKVVGLLGAFADVSEQQALQEERARTTKLESISLLAGGIAHDFKNILTAIHGNLSMVAMQTAPTDPSLDCLQEAQEACRQANELAQQLLAFSRGGVPSKKPTHPERFLRQAVQFSLRGSALAAVWKIEDNLPLVEIDETQMRQVIHHLIMNAVQAQESGRILVGCQVVELSEEEALPLPPGRYVRLALTDEGGGIPPQDLGKIFDPYFTTKPGATGLGLSSAYFIVKKHGGHLAVQSEVGKGSTFEITLPICPARPASAGARSDRPLRGTGKVLFLDDEIQIRTLTERILTFLGFEVTVAANGEEALRYYQEALDAKAPFRFFISDLTLPGGMNGAKVYDRMREMSGEIPAILISGYSDDPITRAFGDYGFKAVLSKPYDLDQVTETLEGLGLL
jgi:PAS domain S-box-containing protein